METANNNLTSKLAPVLLGIHVVALPLYPHMPLPVLLATAMFTLWTLMIIAGRLAQPGRLLMFMLAIVVIAVLLQSFGTILGQQPGSAMLLLLSFLKLFEMRSTRDIAVVIFMGFFLIASNFFYTQSLLIAIYVFVVVVYLTSLLIVFSDRLGTTRLHTRMRKSLRMIVQAVPLMLVLFVLFPRIPGPLWGLPKDAQSSTTGLSDEMSPGSINQLVSSGAVAFRVQFNGDIPTRSELYWRGLVLSNYDGKTWRLDNAPSTAQPLLVDSSVENSNYSYTVMLEPHNQRWLYALESMIDYPSELVLTREMQLLTRNKVTDVISYRLRSDAYAVNQGLFEPERRKNLALPEGVNGRTLGFAEKIFSESNRDKGLYLNNVLKHFGEMDYFYTLSPPLLGEDAMDDFLFNSRRGFCEHYASAFVYLMRAVGIPSRVVIGYQGGAMHPFDDYMIVRQSDAHAWAEVWFEGQGWLRVDPTAAVSPTRIESGIENAGLERELLPLILISDNALFQRVRFMWDSMHNSWNKWIVGYNQVRQKELLELLGLRNVSSSDLVLWLVVCMTLTGGLVAWWVLYRQSDAEHDVVKKIYQRYCNKLERKGIQCQPQYTPVELLRTIRKERPEFEPQASEITRLYQRLRYGPAATKPMIAEFTSRVRAFRAS